MMYKNKKDVLVTFKTSVKYNRKIFINISVLYETDCKMFDRKIVGNRRRKQRDCF